MSRESNSIPTGLYYQGKGMEVESISLSSQTIETINGSKATGERKKALRSPKLLLRALFIFFLLYPLYLHAETISFYSGKEVSQRELQELIKQNPPGPQENIKSTLIHKTEDVSIHLVQIRFKERLHIHKTHDLIVSLKEGKGILHLGGQAISMFEGDTAFIPRGVIHYFENSGDDVAVGIGIFAPAYDGMDMFVVEEGKP